MTTSNNQQQIQPQPGPIAQQLTKIQSNGHQTTTSQPNGQQLPVKKSKWGLAEKTLWDWLQLLIIPFILAVGGFWFTAQQNQISLQNSERQHQIDLQTLKDQQQENALQSYLDHMSDLLLGNNTGKGSPSLTSASPDSEISQVARSRTLTVLRSLDGKRKGILLRFLFEAKLIGYANTYDGYHNSIVSLAEADLQEADLRGADLEGSDLSGADLQGADLSGAMLGLTDLDNTDLRGVNLRGTELVGASLAGANLKFARLRNTTFGCAGLTMNDNRCTDLEYASLDKADLSGVNLDEVNLSAANLSGAKITQEQLSKVKSLKGTTMPDGSKHP